MVYDNLLLFICSHIRKLFSRVRFDLELYDYFVLYDYLDIFSHLWLFQVFSFFLSLSDLFNTAYLRLYWYRVNFNLLELEHMGHWCRIILFKCSPIIISRRCPCEGFCMRPTTAPLCIPENNEHNGWQIWSGRDSASYSSLCSVSWNCYTHFSSAGGFIFSSCLSCKASDICDA